MSKQVNSNGKTLYHIQSITDWHDDPYDMFVYADNESEVRKNLKQLYTEDCGDIDETELKDLIDNTNIYTVYADEIKELLK